MRVVHAWARSVSEHALVAMGSIHRSRLPREGVPHGAGAAVGVRRRRRKPASAALDGVRLGASSHANTKTVTQDGPF